MRTRRVSSPRCRRFPRFPAGSTPGERTDDVSAAWVELAPLGEAGAGCFFGSSEVWLPELDQVRNWTEEPEAAEKVQMYLYVVVFPDGPRAPVQR